MCEVMKMFQIRGDTIFVTRGDSAVFNLDLLDAVCEPEKPFKNLRMNEKIINSA